MRSATKDLSAWLFEDVAWYGPPSWNQVVRATLMHQTFRTVLTLNSVKLSRVERCTL